ncbi:MAG: mechanosensitive ion channel family protein, partial [Erysipelotrichaceae bacterium]|nr:mechanosensitive ion channel family protein [Erysipelotrichaceae bacterium]
PPQESELTGEYMQYAGATTKDANGLRDGFLQIADKADLIQSITKGISLPELIREVVSGTSEAAFMIDEEGIVRITPIFDVLYSNALDTGFTQEQLRNHYYGNLRILDEKFIATSTVLDNNFIYIVGKESTVQQGRWIIVLTSMCIGLATITAFALYMRNRRVTEAPDYEALLYVDVETPSSKQKSTINALRRIMIKDIKWQDKRPEEKAIFVARMIIDVLAAVILIFILTRKTYGNERSIFSFIIGNRWDKGVNIFAFTSSLIGIMLVYLAITVLDHILYMLMNLSNPRNETVIRLIRSFIKYISTLGLIYYTLDQFGFDSKSLLASAGLLTLVIGLGARDLMTDILAGMFLIFENEFQVGDIIEVNGYKGRVAEIGIRTTRIVSTTQDVKSINNRNLTNIVNKTRKNTFCDVIVNVPFDQNIEDIENVLNAELPLLKDRCPYIINGPTYGGLDDLGGKSMRLSIRAECFEPHKFEVRTFVNREIKKLFEEHGFRMV